MAEKVALLERLGPGAAVACDLRCPNFLCRDRPEIKGSAEVVNAYGVKDPIPRRCSHCHVALRVERFIDLESPSGPEAGADDTPLSAFGTSALIQELIERGDLGLAVRVYNRHRPVRWWKRRDGWPLGSVKEGK